MRERCAATHFFQDWFRNVRADLEETTTSVALVAIYLLRSSAIGLVPKSKRSFDLVTAFGNAISIIRHRVCIQSDRRFRTASVADGAASSLFDTVYGEVL